MVKYCIHNLDDMLCLLGKLTNENYNTKLEIISNGTIGQHIRHILEFYTCLIDGLPSGEINYDKRKRDLLIETEIECAIKCIISIKSTLSDFITDRPISLISNFSENPGECIKLHSSFHRELAYNLEHSIHHQAFIKVALKELNLSSIIEKDFGIAPSTLRNVQRPSEELLAELYE